MSALSFLRKTLYSELVEINFLNYERFLKVLLAKKWYCLNVMVLSWFTGMAVLILELLWNYSKLLFEDFIWTAYPTNTNIWTVGTISHSARIHMNQKLFKFKMLTFVLLGPIQARSDSSGAGRGVHLSILPPAGPDRHGTGPALLELPQRRKLSQGKASS